MKFARYGAPGAEKPALIDEDGRLRDLSGIINDLAGPALADLQDMGNLDPEQLAPIEGTPRLGPCIGGTGKFMCIGLNYSDHAAEAGMNLPSEPVLFMKATSSICGPNDPIIIPRGAGKVDWEVELGVVIGRPGKYLSADEALGHVAGYCVINDVSERDFQLAHEGQWTKGKSSDSFGPIGPWLATPDEIGDPQTLGMWLDVNGARMQEGSSATMVFSVAELIAYLSRFFTLHPGDVIATGTPPGVGMGKRPPRFLRPGDEVRLGIDGLGEQRHEVIDDPA